MKIIYYLFIHTFVIREAKSIMARNGDSVTSITNDTGSFLRQYSESRGYGNRGVDLVLKNSASTHYGSKMLRLCVENLPGLTLDDLQSVLKVFYKLNHKDWIYQGIQLEDDYDTGRNSLYISLMHKNDAMVQNDTLTSTQNVPQKYDDNTSPTKRHANSACENVLVFATVLLILSMFAIFLKTQDIRIFEVLVPGMKDFAMPHRGDDIPPHDEM